jgi:hypothetical protein
MTDAPPELPTLHRPYVVGVEKTNTHGILVREEIAWFQDRADAVLFMQAYNDHKAVYGSGWLKTKVWEVQYVR